MSKIATSENQVNVAASVQWVVDSQRKAMEKLLQEATANGFVVDWATLRIDNIDDRWWCPWKYIWWKVEVVCGTRTLVALVQKASTGELV